jgi:lysosomal-trafficking regulator
MHTSWLLSSNESTTDYKELIPEFYFLHEFLRNDQGFNFGLRQSGENIDEVRLPVWCMHKPRLFILIMRQALESNHVTCNLNNWIDLIFGYKQTGKAALEAINCFHPACYFGYPVDEYTDPVHRKALETMIKTWGQTPKQIFQTSHSLPVLSTQVKKNLSSGSSMGNAPPGSSQLFNPADKKYANSVHRLVLNIKWGNYVGSVEQSAQPVCVWKENCKKNMISLISLASNDVIALSNNKCLLVERAKDAGN